MKNIYGGLALSYILWKFCKLLEDYRGLSYPCSYREYFSSCSYYPLGCHAEYISLHELESKTVSDELVITSITIHGKPQYYNQLLKSKHTYNIAISQSIFFRFVGSYHIRVLPKEYLLIFIQDGCERHKLQD